MSTLPKTYITPEQYLDIDRKAEVPSEYLRGEMVPLAGASLEHSLIVRNVSGELREKLRGGRCQSYVSPLRVHVKRTGLYCYPDVVVVCGKPELLDAHNDTLVNPTLIVEVLSPSTEDYGTKFMNYRSIESFREYLVLASDRIYAERNVKTADGWLLTSTDRREDSFELESVGCRLAIAALYEGVEF